MQQVHEKSIVESDRVISSDAFADDANMGSRFKEQDGFLPQILFSDIGLKLDQYRWKVPSKVHYRKAVRDFFDGIDSMPGTWIRR